MEKEWQFVPGQEAHVHDPGYGKGFVFRVYNIHDGRNRIEFAAGELSSGKWGFYTRE
jgi:hypothetical protein